MAVFLSIAVAGALVAQERTVATPLATRLAQVSWSPERQGVLLAVAPEITLGYSVAAPGASLEAVLPAFQRQLVRRGGVSVIAPTHRQAPPTPTDISTLLVTLTAPQWEKLGSPNGLAWSDLTTEWQQRLLLAQLPDPLRLHAQSGRLVSPTEYRLLPPPVTMPDRELVGDQRRSVHLRLQRRLIVELAVADPVVRSRVEAALPITFPQTVSPYYQLRGATAGVSAPHRPNTLTEADIAAFAAAAQPISLEGVSTVSGLVARLAQATGRELYVRPALGRLSVWVRGTSALAKDLASALCLAVGGRFRPVGPALVLTDRDDSPPAPTLPRDGTAEQQLRHSPLANDFPLQGNQLYGFTAAQLREGAHDGLEVARLPDAQQGVVKRQIAQQNDDYTQDRRQVWINGQRVRQLDDTRVWLRQELSLALVLPESGAAVDLPTSLSLLEHTLYRSEPRANLPPAPPLRWPHGERVAWVRPTTPAEAAALAEATKAAGLDTLWVSVPPDIAQARALLAAAHKPGLRLFAGVVAQHFDPQALVDLAKTPQLSGLVFDAVFAPAAPQQASLTDRLAFLRQTNCDPLDLAWEERELTLRWDETQRQRQQEQLVQLYRRLKERAPTCLLRVNDPGTAYFWVGSWDAAERLPWLSSRPTAESAALRAARQLSRTALNAIVVDGGGTAATVRHGLDYIQKNAPGWDGTVLILKDVPPAQVQSLLAALK